MTKITPKQENNISQNKSTELSEKSLKENFKEIFRAIDTDNDGSVSLTKIDLTSNIEYLILSELPSQCQGVIKQFIKIIKEKQMTWHIEDFTQALLLHYKNTLSPVDKKIILYFKKQKCMRESASQPTIKVYIYI